MNLKPPIRRHGFRFSIWDALILILAATFTLWLRSIGLSIWWIVPMAVGHFLVFCNVFLVWRKLELLWAVALVVNVLGHGTMGDLRWLSPFLWQLPMTLLVIWLQIRSPWYHGVFAQRLNPRLNDFLQGHL